MNCCKDMKEATAVDVEDMFPDPPMLEINDLNRLGFRRAGKPWDIVSIYYCPWCGDHLGD